MVYTNVSAGSDAERNRGEILTAARQAFADPEAEVSVAEIAARAIVGMAILYRNFLGRHDLLEAVFFEVSPSSAGRESRLDKARSEQRNR